MWGTRTLKFAVLSGSAQYLNMAKYQIAILDDYQNIALSYSGWEGIKEHAEITVFNKHLEPEELPTVLEPFDAIIAMYEFCSKFGYVMLN